MVHVPDWEWQVVGVVAGLGVVIVIALWASVVYGLFWDDKHDELRTWWKENQVANTFGLLVLAALSAGIVLVFLASWRLI